MAGVWSGSSWVVLSSVDGVDVELGAVFGEAAWLGQFFSVIQVTSASSSNSFSVMELHLSSTKRGADN